MVRINAVVLLTLGLLLSGCATPVGPVVIDPAFDSYIQEFESECSQFRRYCRVYGISIYFEPLEWPTLGVCYTRSDGSRRVVMNEATWGVLSSLERMNLFRHEMGHCLFFYEHYLGGVSIMSPALINDFDYSEALLKRFYTEGY